MDLDLINIDPKPREVPASMRKNRLVCLGNITTIEGLNTIFQKALEELRASGNGYSMFRLKFFVRETEGLTDREEQEPACYVEGSRMETPEETASRVRKQTAYNEGRLKDRQERLHNIDLRKERERILGHLTIDQLRSLSRLDPESFQPPWVKATEPDEPTL